MGLIDEMGLIPCVLLLMWVYCFFFILFSRPTTWILTLCGLSARRCPLSRYIHINTIYTFVLYIHHIYIHTNKKTYVHIFLSLMHV